MSVIWDATDTTVVSIVRLWTKHDGRVRWVKYKGHDRRVRNIHQLSNDVGLILIDQYRTLKKYKDTLTKVSLIQSAVSMN